MHSGSFFFIFYLFISITVVLPLYYLQFDFWDEGVGSPEYKTDLFVTISLQWAHIAISWNMDIPFTPSEYYEIPGFLFCFLYYCCLL